MEIKDYMVDIEGHGAAFINSTEAGDEQSAVKAAKVRLRVPSDSTAKVKVDVFINGTQTEVKSNG